jgi:hypothetical protein
MFDTPQFTDAELDTLGVAPRETEVTRTERGTVKATCDAINDAAAQRRRSLLQTLFGDELFLALSSLAIAHGVAVDALELRIPDGKCAPDAVVGFKAHDGDGAKTFTVLAVLEFKRAAADNAHEPKVELDGSWKRTRTTRSGRVRTVQSVHQCDGYRGDPNRWLNRQDDVRWCLATGGVDAVLWVLVCEYPRDDAPDGWVVRSWAPLVVHELAAVRAGQASVVSSAGPLLREWIAPHREHLYDVGRPRPVGSLRAAAVAAFNDNHGRISHRRRNSQLVKLPAGGWGIADSAGIDLPAGHPEFRQWAEDVRRAGELLADDTCPGCKVPARRCGHIDIDGNRWIDVMDASPELTA